MKVAIIGCGDVGATIAYVMMQRGFLGEIVLANRDYDRALGCYLDLKHASAFHPGTTFVPLGLRDLGQCRDADLFVIAAGCGLSATKIGDRNLLATENAVVVGTILGGLSPQDSSRFVVITNPVDNMTYITVKALTQMGVPPRHVIGLGTSVESARFRAMLSSELGRPSTSLRETAIVLGEHGTSMVMVTSLLTKDDQSYIEGDQDNIGFLVRNAAQSIRLAQRTGPKYSIALCAWDIIASVLDLDGHPDGFQTVSTYVEVNSDYGVDDVSLSLPCVIDRSGIAEIRKVSLSPSEITSLRSSAGAIKDERRKLRDLLIGQSTAIADIAKLC